MSNDTTANEGGFGNDTPERAELREADRERGEIARSIGSALDALYALAYDRGAAAAVPDCASQGVEGETAGGRRLVYLASPYSSSDLSVRDARFEAVCREAAVWMNEGVHIYSPIAHTHPIAVRGELPTDWRFWEAYDRVMIDAADEVWVLMLDGWQDSRGVTAEVKIAGEQGKVVRYIEPRAAAVPPPPETPAYGGVTADGFKYGCWDCEDGRQHPSHLLEAAPPETPEPEAAEAVLCKTCGGSGRIDDIPDERDPLAPVNGWPCPDCAPSEVADCGHLEDGGVCIECAVPEGGEWERVDETTDVYGVEVALWQRREQKWTDNVRAVPLDIEQAIARRASAESEARADRAWSIWSENRIAAERRGGRRAERERDAARAEAEEMRVLIREQVLAKYALESTPIKDNKEGWEEAAMRLAKADIALRSWHEPDWLIGALDAARLASPPHQDGEGGAG